MAGLPHSGKNIRKMKFFPGQGKVREFCGWPGKFREDLENQGKVREFENKWLWQSSKELYILFKRGKDIRLGLSPLSLGAILKGKNLLPGGANSYL